MRYGHHFIFKNTNNQTQQILFGYLLVDSWSEWLYLLASVVLYIPLLKLLFYHMNIVGFAMEISKWVDFPEFDHPRGNPPTPICNAKKIQSGQIAVFPLSPWMEGELAPFLQYTDNAI